MSLSNDIVPTRIAGRPWSGREAVEVRNPFGGAVVGAVPLCGPAEVDRACEAALAALRRRDFPAWRRAEVLERGATLLRERGAEFARTICLEAGKPIALARAEAARAVDTLLHSAVEARAIGVEGFPSEGTASGAGKLAFALREPAGVVAAIAPFNFPLNLVAHKLGPAIAAGCPVVLKPAPQTPLSAIALVELLVEAGLPEDWISVATDGGSEAGAALVEHAIPAVVTFTGSAAVGWRIAAIAARKKTLLELGSNSPAIVEPDADVALAAKKLAAGAFAYSGQTCISTQRVLAHESIRDELAARIAEAAAALALGDPADERTNVGPLIRERENARVAEWIGEAVARGGRIAAGGDLRDGIYAPTVVENPPADCRLVANEIFGPVVAVRPYRDFEAAIAEANASELGIHVGVFTRDVGKALDAVRRLDFGGVLVNETPTFRMDPQPYGGVRESGNTREGPKYAVAEMTRLKFVSLQG